MAQGSPSAAPMSRNAVAVCRVFDEMLNRGRFDVADEICAADAELHAPLSNVGTGPEGLRQLASGMRLGFADLEVAIDDLIVAEDKVVVRWHTVRQTHTGLYRGVPPTGRSLKVTAIQIFRMEDAMIAEAWLEIDALGAARAMGIVPSEDDSAGRRALFTIGSLFRMAFLEARWAMRSRGR